ncbi:hypothetical protein BK809_0004801 [Diplodia seriata]|uniref:DUF7924 domain-containing protein n=1 Tax=Diplodia seriata TaxID=420778 RepID=A0A1S8B780_9PEZI|nr:hypothetical protein BK809_0004801 [Diplodia seriata]
MPANVSGHIFQRWSFGQRPGSAIIRKPQVKVYKQPVAIKEIMSYRVHDAPIDIGRLVVPSPETLCERDGFKNLEPLIESVDELWTKAIPLHRDLPRPKPNFSVGSRSWSFTEKQLEKLKVLGVASNDKTKYYRHKIRTLYLTDQNGKERWTAYKFTKNVYDNWMPPHFKRICNAIDEIPPGTTFGVPKLRSTSL